MPESAKTLEVNIFGRSYKIACEPENRDALLRAVAFLDEKMNEVRAAGKVTGTERIAVMVALNLVHELIAMQVGDGFDIGKVKRRIVAIEATVEAALARQEKLF